MFQVDRIDHVALSVSDTERSISWYREHLGFQRLYEGEWDGPPFMVGAGTACLALFPARAGGHEPARIRALHVAFGATRENFEAARRQLEGVREVEHENCWSIYFADPDGHQLEITTYEAP